MPSVRHGAFTYGLLSAFKAGLRVSGFGVSPGGDSATSMERIFSSAADFVARSRPNLKKPQEPRFTAPASLRKYDWSIPASGETAF